MNSPELSLALSILQVVLAVVILGLVIAVLRAQRAKRAPVGEQPAAAAYQQAPVNGVSPEVVAAITAAIATVWDKDTGFVVRHVRRVDNAPAWNRSGREDQTYSRL